jgi:hypothetical protein
MPMMERYFDGVFRELRVKTEERGHIFHSKGTPGTTMSELLDVLSVRPRVRHPFGIESDLSMLVGFILIPGPERNLSDRAWNRFDQDLCKRIAKAEQDGCQGKSLSFVIIQIWEREKRCVLIPFKELDTIPNFREKGNFTVLKDCGEFFLQKPWYEPKIRLKDRLEQIFEFLGH